MPIAPRVPGKAREIAYKLLGKPAPVIWAFQGNRKKLRVQYTSRVRY